MKRFRRWQFNGIAALSLVLGVTSCVLWVRSSKTEDCFSWGWHPNRDRPWQINLAALSSQNDHVELEIDFVGDGFPSDPIIQNHWNRYSLPIDLGDEVPEIIWNHLGFYFSKLEWTFGGQDMTASAISQGLNPLQVDEHFGIPDWFVIAGFSILPFIWVCRLISSRRFAKAGSCRVCGYDLRAAPD